MVLKIAHLTVHGMQNKAEDRMCVVFSASLLWSVVAQERVCVILSVNILSLNSP